MSLTPKDLTPVYNETIGKGAGARRWQRPVYVDLLPPCNHACPAGENIQAWLALAQAGDYEGAWRKYMEENPNITIEAPHDGDAPRPLPAEPEPAPGS